MASLDDIVAGVGNDEEVELDFSGAVEFEPIAVGDYRAVVKECVSGVSKPSAASPQGNPKLVWTFVITEEGSAKGRQQMRHTPTTGKGSGLSKQVLKAVGEDITATQIKVKPAKYVGKEVILSIGIQDGTEFNEITKVKPVPAAK